MPIPTNDLNPEAKARSVIEFIVKLARALHSSGLPSYELDSRMEKTALGLGIPAIFFSTPTALLVTFEDENHSTRMIRVWPSETNLGRLTRLYLLHRQIDQGIGDLADWSSRLEEIESDVDGYNAFTNLISYGAVSAGAAILLGGNLTVVIAAGLIGVIVGLLLLIFQKRNYPLHLTNVIAGFLVTVLASAVHFWFPEENVRLTTLAALIILLPGLQMTIGINELATQNLSSGSARIAGAMTTLLTLVFGVVMGTGFASLFVQVQPSTAAPTPAIVLSAVAVVPMAFAFGVLFRSRKRELLWILLSTAISFGLLRFNGLFLSPLAAVWTTALLLGLISNFLMTWRNLPTAVMLMPGLLLLVPGSLGFFGMSAIMQDNDLPNGIQVATTMILIAVAIVAAVLLANVIIPSEPLPKRDRPT